MLISSLNKILFFLIISAWNILLQVKPKMCRGPEGLDSPVGGYPWECGARSCEADGSTGRKETDSHGWDNL